MSEPTWTYPSTDTDPADVIARAARWQRRVAAAHLVEILADELERVQQ